MNNMKRLSLLATISLCTCILSAQSLLEEVQADWMVYGNDVNTKYPADVPGNIYTDLMAAEVIQDPFKGTNETDVEWVARENWTYESDTFSVSPELLNKSHVVMRFEGLDTYCNVWLNGEHILSANNYFIPWEVDVKGKLKKSGNQLTVKFRSATVTGEIMAGRTPYDLPGAEVRAVTRKPQFHYGWDWGPTLPDRKSTRLNSSH